MSSGFVFPVADPRATITSGIGSRRSPGGIGSTNHRGVDIGGPRGAPIVAPVDIRITRAGVIGGYGNAVYGVDANGLEHRFAHMDALNVRAGQTVRAGGMIGSLGSTGNSTGPHLHYEQRDSRGRVIDPSALLNRGRRLASDLVDRAIDAAIAGNPLATGIKAATDAIGLTGGASWIEQIRNWIAESGFFQRTALAIVAFIFIFAAFYLLGRGEISKLVKG